MKLCTLISVFPAWSEPLKSRFIYSIVYSVFQVGCLTDISILRCSEVNIWSSPNTCWSHKPLHLSNRHFSLCGPACKPGIRKFPFPHTWHLPRAIQYDSIATTTNLIKVTIYILLIILLPRYFQHQTQSAPVQYEADLSPLLKTLITFPISHRKTPKVFIISSIHTSGFLSHEDSLLQTYFPLHSSPTGQILSQQEDFALDFFLWLKYFSHKFSTQRSLFKCYLIRKTFPAHLI